MRQYFTTFVLIRGFFIALLGSAFIYLHHFNFSVAWIDTLLGIASLYLLLKSNTKVWFVSGAFFALLWFWWITLSLIHYTMLWATPIVLLMIMLTYGAIFASISWISTKLGKYLTLHSSLLTPHSSLFTLHSSLLTPHPISQIPRTFSIKLHPPLLF